MENIKRKIYKEFHTVDSAENLEIDTFSGKRPILFVSEFSFSPPTDVWESDKEVTVMMEVADLTLQDFGIDYREGYLIVEGERKAPDTTQTGSISKYYKKEIDYGKFLVKVKMNTRIAREKITASYKNGMLIIHLPKNIMGKPSGKHTIPIKT